MSRYRAKIHIQVLCFMKFKRGFSFQEGDKTPVRAAASLCPAWDVSQAFRRLSDFFPAVRKYCSRKH